MTRNAFTALAKEWQAWITENLDRGCEPGGMAEIMVRDGRFERATARAAIEAASNQPLPEPGQPRPRPDVDTSSNTVQTPDREVQILMALEKPRVVLLGNVLSDEECDALYAEHREKMAPSPVVSEVDGKNEMHPHRTSQGAMSQRAESPLLERIEARLAALVKWPANHGEGMQILQYEVGHEYRAHFDWFDPTQAGPAKHMAHGGQRVGTIVMYLSEVEAGGGTGFPSIGLQVQPKKGCAVFFANTDEFGQPEPLTLHAGLPVVRGVKRIATKWLREKVY